MVMPFTYNTKHIIHEKNINMLNLIKIRNFFSMNGNINRMKRQNMNWKKRLAKDTSDKRLLAKLSKEHLKFNYKKTNNPIKK